ncbi:hypothetical protein RIF29_29577 [Crotalaria pallida]|uniref:E3 ubiquitin-protein ligase CHIP n=1 Tax=Crotalaria pallida TaxID=3830 RepID=A0AAN9EET3_CROPI
MSVRKERDMGSSQSPEEAKQAELLRIDGNSCFKKQRFTEAIDAYTEAITLCPNVAVYYTNRALCHLKRSDWIRVEEDSRRAIQLDSNSVKAHYLLGLALQHRQEYGKGCVELQTAFDLDRGANSKGHMVEEIWKELAKAKYQEWERSSSKRSQELQQLKESCESALREKYFNDVSFLEGFIEVPHASHSKQLEALGRVFDKVAEADIPTEVPHYLCCKITLEIFRDPIITPSGHTYEKAAILTHLEKVGKFDPTTRQPLYPWQLVPNYTMKEVVQAFLDKNGWAYKTD